jgi:23S rRNA (guanosine2251-2'-O)-methyltransferase
MRQITCIAHDIRSIHNVGSLLRTCDGLGIDRLILSGYTPYPLARGDMRLPHEARSVHNRITKTALGAEESVNWIHADDITSTIKDLKADGYQIIALEQTSTSISLPDFQPSEKVALLLGREVEGIDPELLELCDDVVEIPMLGDKESFNVVHAAAIALYHCRYVAPNR